MMLVLSMLYPFSFLFSLGLVLPTVPHIHGGSVKPLWKHPKDTPLCLLGDFSQVASEDSLPQVRLFQLSLKHMA